MAIYQLPSGATGDWHYRIDPAIGAIWEQGLGQNYAYSSSETMSPVRGRTADGGLSGTPEEILGYMLSGSGVSADQFRSLLPAGTDPYSLLSYGAHPALYGVQQGFQGPNQALAYNDVAPLAAMLQGAGVDWRNIPQFSSLYDQGSQAAQERANQIGATNAPYQGNFFGNVVLPGLGVLGAGYLGGTGLGALQGTGSFMDLLLNPSLTGGNLGGSLAGDAAWGVMQGASPDWVAELAQYSGLESLGGLNASELASLGITPESLGLATSGAGTDFSNLFSPNSYINLPIDEQNALRDLYGLGATGASTSSSWLDRLLGGGSGGGLPGLGGNSSLGGLLGGLLGGATGGNLLGSALGLAPILGGLAYAYNQSDFDTGRLEDLYGQYNPNSMAYLYDQNTLAGRDQLTSNLARRGLTGSSFANMDLTNYNTQRDLGRASLISGAVPAATGIASNILNADIKERELKNNLIGAGLYSIGTMFGGRR